MHTSISAWLLVVLTAHEVDSRLSGDRQVIAGLDGLQTTPPTSSYELFNSHPVAPLPHSSLGGGGNKEQFAFPSNFGENGSRVGDKLDGTGTESEPLLGHGGHGQQITLPNDFEEEFDAIYGNNKTGEGNISPENDFEADSDLEDEDELLDFLDEDEEADVDTGDTDADVDTTDGDENDGYGDETVDGDKNIGDTDADVNTTDADADGDTGDTDADADGDENVDGDEDAGDADAEGDTGDTDADVDDGEKDIDGDGDAGDDGPENTTYGDSKIDGFNEGSNGTLDLDTIDGFDSNETIFMNITYGDNSTTGFNENVYGNSNVDGTVGAFGENPDSNGVGRFNGTDGNFNGREDGFGINGDDRFQGNGNVNGMDEDIDGGDNDGADDSNLEDTSSAPSPALVNGGWNFPYGAGLPSYYNNNSNRPSPTPFGSGPYGNNFGKPTFSQLSNRPSPTPFGSGPYGNNFGKPTFGGNDFGKPTFGQSSNGASPTAFGSGPYGNNFGNPTSGPTSSPAMGFTTTSEPPVFSPQGFPTMFPQPTRKPVVYKPPIEENLEQGQNGKDSGEKEDTDTGGTEDMQGEPSVGGTNGIEDAFYFDHAESINEMEHDRNVVIALGIAGGIGLCLAIITAQQMLENPNGCLASICRIMVAAICGVTRFICCPCRMICGCTSKQDRYSNELISGGYNEQYISDLELT